MSPVCHEDRALDLGDDHFHDACGVFAVWGHPDAARLTALGLHALQHRGQESAGIVSIEATRPLTAHAHRAMGLVQDAFTAATLAGLRGDVALGHVRYSTTGESHLRNAQPLLAAHQGQPLACAHNGNLTNTDALKRGLDAQGAVFQSSTDTEVFLHLAARARGDSALDRVIEALGACRGAWSVAFLAGRQLIAARDPHGLRPLCLGTLGRAHVVASEPVAFDLIGARYVRDLDPGEVLVIDADGARAYAPFEPVAPRFCVFEHVYFARPDSTLGGQSVYDARRAMGRALGREAPADADLVIGVPDSGVAAALGYAEASSLAFEVGLLRSRFVNRTFIEPVDAQRQFGVRMKLSPVAAALRGRRVVVVDDSIVRGTTARKLVAMLRDAGAREVHLRVASPPTRWPCFYGIDTPDRDELVAAHRAPAEVNALVGADSLGYLSLEGLRGAVNGQRGGFCDACFTGEYPVPFVPVGALTARTQHGLAPPVTRR
ncbi:MAG: amidophosphoribosyltransferase [Myxococcales bacterium]|nr:amidophosphoribosyltransferase [Myxococcales bacterium]